MDEKSLRTAYLEAIEDHCNVVFDEEHLPGGVLLALEELVRTDPESYRTTSVSLSDMSKGYANNGGDWPKYIIRWLSPYVRVNLAGDKRKRPYYDGRG